MKALIVGIVASLIAAGAIMYFYQAEMKQGFSAGVAFARTANRGECVESSLDRLGSDIGIAERVRILSFSRACLQHARPDPQYCDQIPSNPLEASTLISRQCSKFDSESKTCEQVLQYSASACAGSLPGMT